MKRHQGARALRPSTEQRRWRWLKQTLGAPECERQSCAGARFHTGTEETDAPFAVDPNGNADAFQPHSVGGFVDGGQRVLE